MPFMQALTKITLGEAITIGMLIVIIFMIRKIKK